MKPLVRRVLLVGGLGVIALLVWQVGVQAVLHLLARAGWSLLAVIGIYALHVTVRAVSLWRTLLSGSVQLRDVLRVRLSAEAVEMLTFTGPFLAEPAKGWLLTRHGAATEVAFAAVITEYLLYNVASASLAIAALWLLVDRHILPPGPATAATVVVALLIVFLLAVGFAAVTGIGLIAPILRGSRVLIGGERALRAARDFTLVEDQMIEFLHGRPAQLAQVLALEFGAQSLLILEIWIVAGALGLSRSWADAMIVEGSAKFVSIAFAFIPGQLGASEGVFALLADAIGWSAAAGLSLALVRRLRSLVVAAAGVIALALMDR